MYVYDERMVWKLNGSIQQFFLLVDAVAVSQNHIFRNIFSIMLIVHKMARISKYKYLKRKNIVIKYKINFVVAEQFQSCHRNDPNMDSCLAKAIESAIQTIGSKGKYPR